MNTKYYTGNSPVLYRALRVQASMYDRTLEQEQIHASEEWTRINYIDSNAYGESVRYWLEYEGRDWGDDNPDKVLKTSVE